METGLRCVLGKLLKPSTLYSPDCLRNPITRATTKEYDYDYNV